MNDLFDTELERAFISVLFLDASKLVDCKLSVADLSMKNGLVFSAIKAAALTGEPDYVTVCDELERAGTLEKVGGASYITEICASPGNIMNAATYEKQLRELSVRRSLVKNATLVSQLALNGSDISDVVSSMQAAALEAAEATVDQSNVVTAKEMARAFYDRIERFAQNPLKPGEVRGLRTHIDPLDRQLDGLRPALCYVAGRPGAGKTAMMLQMARGFAGRENKHCALFTMEMSASQLMDRLACGMCGIDIRRIRSGNLTDEEMPRLIDAIGTISGWPITIIDQPALKPSELAMHLKRLCIKGSAPDAVLIDGLWLMDADKHFSMRVYEVDSISHSLKAIQRGMGVPFVVTHQLSRAIENRVGHVPQLSDLRDSGGVEADADIAMFISQTDRQNRDANQVSRVVREASVYVLKDRDGPTATVYLGWHGESQQFVSLHNQPETL